VTRQSLEGVGTLASSVAGMLLPSCAMVIAESSADAPAARSTGIHVAASQLKLGVTTLAALFWIGGLPRLGAAYGAATDLREVGQRE
jgi:hypothetical protein